MSQQNMRTPRWLFNALNDKFGPFKLDAAADENNHLCTNYFTEQTSGLTHVWSDCNFCNPPFKKFKDWVYKAYRSFYADQRKTVLIGPACCSQQWAQKYIKPHATVYIPDMRIQYLMPDGTPTRNNRVDTMIYTFGYYRPTSDWHIKDLPLKEIKRG